MRYCDILAFVLLEINNLYISIFRQTENEISRFSYSTVHISNRIMTLIGMRREKNIFIP